MILSRHARSEACFPRQRTGAAPQPLPRLRGWGHDLRDAVIAVCLLAALWWLLLTI